MSEKNSKDIRKQVRNVMQEVMPSLLQEIAKETMYKDLRAHIDSQLRALEQQVKLTLTNIDDRAKDLQSLMLREMVARNTPPPAEEPPPAA